MKYIITIFLLAVYAESAFCAQPTIQGTSIGVDTVTVTGANFGAYPQEGGDSNILNMFFSTWDDTTDPLDGGKFHVDVGTLSANWTVVSNGRAGGHHLLRLNDTKLADLRYTQPDIPIIAPAYSSFWYRESGLDYIGKMFRWYFSDGTNNQDFFVASSGTSQECAGGVDEVWWTNPLHKDGWQFVEVLFDNTTQQVHMWVDGVYQQAFHDMPDWWASGSGCGWNTAGQTVRLGYYDTASNDTWEFDDWYVSYNYARVLMCVGSTWDTRGQCDIQPPVSWSDSNLSLQKHITLFSPGDTAYLYIVNDTNEWNINGYQITIGAGTGPLRSAGAPTGEQPAGTTQVTMSLTTDEVATCRYSTVAGTAYADMTDTFVDTGGTSHSTVISGLSNGGYYTYYVRCAGTDTNADDYVISWSVQREHHRIGSMPVIH